MLYFFFYTECSAFQGALFMLVGFNYLSNEFKGSPLYFLLII